MNDEAKKQVLSMVKAASEAKDSGDAMRLSQAALNAANALGVLAHAETHLNSPAK